MLEKWPHLALRADRTHPCVAAQSLLFDCHSVCGFAQRIRHHRTTLAHWQGRAGRGVYGCLMLHLGIDRGTGDKDDDGNPCPHHQTDNGAERSVGGVVVGEMLQIE